MLSEREAIGKLKLFNPDCHPAKIIIYNGLYLIFAPQSDPYEGALDPYFSVNINTGETRDYSIYQDGKAREIVELFKNAPEIGRG